MLARSPAAVKKRRYRARLRNGIVSLDVDVHEHGFAEALITSKRLSEQQALRRDKLAREAADILRQFIERWRP